MYRFSRTPDAPENSECREGGEHKPVELVGTNFGSVAYTIMLDDGGAFSMGPCARCGLVYWTVKKDAWAGRPEITGRSVNPGQDLSG